MLWIAFIFFYFIFWLSFFLVYIPLDVIRSQFVTTYWPHIKTLSFPLIILVAQDRCGPEERGYMVIKSSKAIIYIYKDDEF